MIISYNNKKGQMTAEFESNHVVVRIQGIEYDICEAGDRPGVVVSKRIGRTHEMTHLRRTIDISIIEPNRVAIQ